MTIRAISGSDSVH